MGIDIRLPQINARTEGEQLVQIRSYLYQLAEQLQWALSNVDTSLNSVIVAPTPRVIGSSSGSAVSPQATFDSIKALIIKSADIVDAYYEEINKKLVGLYVAQSDFGTYSEETASNIKANSTSIEQTYSNLQEIRVGIGSNLNTLSEEVGQIDTELQGVKEGIDTNLNELTEAVGQLDANLENAKATIDTDIQGLKGAIDSLNSLVEVNANIKSGLLYDEEGIPVYGIEIGQKNIIDGEEVFNKFARFTAGRLSFYDNNGSEVAYISDYKLYITHAEITGTLKLGGYLVDTTKGLAFKWVGRG
jgi:hypothetical protein